MTPQKKSWKEHVNFKNVFYAAIITLAAQGVYKNVTGFMVDAYRTVKNTPVQDECIRTIKKQNDTIIESLRTGYVKRDYFRQHIRRDSAKYAEVDSRLVKLEYGRHQR